MSLLLFAVLLQSQVTEGSVQELVNEFLKGSQTARADLLKLGVYSVRPLLKHRKFDSRKLHALLFEIKLAAAYPSPVVLPGSFEDREGMVNNRQWSDAGALLRLFHRKDVPLFAGPFDDKHLIPTHVAVMNPLNRLQLVELFCTDTGLDYGFFHNSVVVGLPERLWPEQLPSKPRPLTESEFTRARKLMNDLGDSSIEVRELASRDLLGLGAGVVPVLEDQRIRSNPELVARLDLIIRELTKGPSQFGPPACLRQKLSIEDEQLLKKIRLSNLKLTFENAPLSEILKTLNTEYSIPVKTEESLGKTPTTVLSCGQNLLDLICLITQSHDLDFVISNGSVVIDTRRAIEHRLAQGK